MFQTKDNAELRHRRGETIASIIVTGHTRALRKFCRYKASPALITNLHCALATPFWQSQHPPKAKEACPKVEPFPASEALMKFLDEFQFALDAGDQIQVTEHLM